jgi:hypothetical protein
MDGTYAGFTEIFLNLRGTVEMFYAFFDRIRKKYDKFIFRQSLFDNLDGQSQNRYRKLVDVVVVITYVQRYFIGTT